tara:strand:- start:914 stop:1093 length:180 start_codon:yes stop_codon:yes gene_type:complete
MPKVGGQHFAYTPEGKAKAKAKAKSTGQAVKYDYSGPEMKGNKPRVSGSRTPSTGRRTY